MIPVAPSNIESEESILGGLILDNQAIDKIPDFPVEAFYVSAHRTIYSEILQLHSTGNPFDLMLLASRLTDTGKIESVGGIGKLAQLVDRTVSAVNIDRHAALILEKWKRRTLIATFQEAISEAYDTAIAWEEIQAKTESRITDIFAQKQSAGMVHISEIMPQIFMELSSGTEPSIPTGLNQVDAFLSGGLRPGELTVLAGRPSMGKSAIAGQVAVNVAKESPVLFFSGEMSSASIVRRLLASELQINQSHLLANRFPEERADHLGTAMNRVGSFPIYLDETPGYELTIPYMVSESQKIHRKHGEIGLIIVDYLQLLGDQDASNRVNNLGKFTAFFKGLSKKLHCHIMALSQLSRKVEERNNKRPVMSDLRDSGCIEQDADAILFLYRDEYYIPETCDRGIIEIGIGKNRNGERGVAKALFDGATSSIKNLNLTINNSYEDRF